MPSLLSRYQRDVAARPSTTMPLIAYFLASFLSCIPTSTKHGLLTSAVAWLAIWLYATLRTGPPSLSHASSSQCASWTAGVSLALAGVCEGAVDASGIWWAKALLPALIYVMARGGILDKPSKQGHTNFTRPTKLGLDRSPNGSKTNLLILTMSGFVSVYAHAGSITIIALGLSYAVLKALAFYLIERAQDISQPHNKNGDSVNCTANGMLTQPQNRSTPTEERSLSTLRDVSMAGALTAALASFALESRHFGGLVYLGWIGHLLGDHWMSVQGTVAVVYVLSTVLIHMIVFAATVLVIQRQGAFLTTLVPLSAAVSSQLLLGFSVLRLWFAALCAISCLSFLDEHHAIASRSRMRMRYGRLVSLAAVVSFICLAVLYLRQPLRAASHPNATSAHSVPVQPLSTSPPSKPSEPLPHTDAQTHPVKHLVENAQASWNDKLKGQSQTLAQAVTEYRRRYGVPPPPHFDKWYEFAKRKGVQLIDDYDTIYHSLLPFWGLRPATIRARTREALGFVDNNLMGLLIRGGKAVHVEGGQEWLQQAAVGMMEQFIEFLPDMDLAFNVHDEPRVVVPHDELSRLIDIALTQDMPIAKGQQKPRNSFSVRPQGVGNGKRIAEVKTTRFNIFAHQPTWIPSRLSCSPDSPSRGLEDSLLTDNLTAYALSDLAFVYNQTAFSDICNSPSFGQSHGFFDRPNAFNVVHDLFPIFSQSKMSSFQDITYPSPWYWYGKVSYNELKDMDWSKKANRLWWRGSTTGGFSRAGGWRRQHRQKFVTKVNALDNAKILSSSNAGATDENPGLRKWLTKEVSRPEFKDIMDVHFSHVGQCDPGDCDAQREFFTIVEPADQQEAWNFKYLLDLDGNAFSGRFYAFLRSHSLIFKMAVFREWHEEWIKPWVHYIPLSLKGEEVLEAIRYFDAEEEGKELATVVAENGRSWAQKALRNEDFEAWFFRLLLEYGRVIDDNRGEIGYTAA